MPKIGDSFGTKREHHDHLTVHGKDLYWHGKKVRVGGWSRSERLILLGIVLAFAIGLPAAIAATNWEQVKSGVCSFYSSTFCVKPINKTEPKKKE